MAVAEHQTRARAAKAARARVLGLAIGATALIAGPAGCGGSDHSSTAPQAEVNLPTVTAPGPLPPPTGKQSDTTAPKENPAKSSGAKQKSTGAKRESGHHHGSQQQDAGEATGVKPRHKLNKNSDSGGSRVQPQHKGSNDPQGE